MKKQWIDPKIVKVDIHNCSFCGVRPEIYKEEYVEYPSQYYFECPKCRRYAFSAVSLEAAATYWNQFQEREF